MFPIRIGGIPIIPPGSSENFDPPPPMLCACPAPPPVFTRPGIGISFWEPARIAEVVRTPMCSPTLNGIVLGALPVPAGTHHHGDGIKGQAFYHVHWIQYPVLNWLGMAFTSGACFINETFDVAYLSELDPLWDDDELSFILNPEAVLFANPLTQSACVADTLKAAVTGFGIDSLFWCSGSQGSVYPLSGSHANHSGGIDSSLALVHKLIFKLHRQLIAQDTSTPLAMCGGIPQPVLRKSQYKQQMMYPIPQNIKGYGLGAPSMVWGTGREFPYKGEDFSYLMWRKRSCCAF
jgi:conjugal transfer pilus assembly protein TraU